MLKKRIIPCLDVKNGRTVKGINFEGIRDAGDPVELAEIYSRESADELVFLDITATLEKRKTLVNLVQKVAQKINIPFTVGGGIQSLEDASAVIDAGADKISINSAAVNNPSLITNVANEFGNQCVVVAIDAKPVDGEWMVFTQSGKTASGLSLLQWAKRAETMGAGEILFTSIENDGTKNGFALEITDTVSRAVQIPVIASGGAGTIGHFKALFEQTQASAALAASIFHYQEISIPELKESLTNFVR